MYVLGNMNGDYWNILYFGVNMNVNGMGVSLLGIV